MVSVLSVLVLMVSQQVAAGSSYLNLKEKLKVAGCGSEVDNTASNLMFDGGKKFVAQTNEGDNYSGKYKYSSKKRLYTLTFNGPSKKVYTKAMADWAGDICDVNKAKIKNVKYKNFSLKLNKKKTNGKLKFSSSMTGHASGESASIKHTIVGKGAFTTAAGKGALSR